MAAQQDQKQKQTKQQDNTAKWDMINKKLGVEEAESQFPLVQYKPPEGFESKY